MVINMTIYIDLFFMINFITDLIIVTLMCGARKTNIFRKILSAFFGSLYACLYFTTLPEYFFSLAAKSAVLAGMCAICFVPCRIKELIRYYVKALFISVFFSGAVLSVKAAISDTTSKEISDLVLAAGFCMGYLMLKYTVKTIKKHRPENEYRITVYHNNKKIILTGICDSGNSLCDPLSGLPVIIVDFNAIKKLFSGISSPQELCEFSDPKDFKAIPYKTIGSTGIVYGFIPNKILNGYGDEIKAIIAAAPIRLSTDMLYNPMLLGI